MDDDIVVGAACTTLICASFGAVLTIAAKKPKKRQHQIWVREYISKRNEFGAYNSLLPEIASHERYYHYLRMDVDTTQCPCYIHYNARFEHGSRQPSSDERKNNVCS